MKRPLEYVKKAKIQRQIQSNKAERFATFKKVDIAATVLLAGLLAFLSFTDLAQGSSAIGWTQKLLTFALLMFVVFHYAFRVGEKEQECWRAVVALSSFINEVEDMVSQAQRGLLNLDLAKEEVLKHKYDALMANIPENSDREFVQAKADFLKKERATSNEFVPIGGIFDDAFQKRTLENLIRNSDTLLDLLGTMRSVNIELYLVGGAVRDLVWDHLHAFPTAAQFDDVDVVYFNQLNASKAHDEAIEKQLMTRRSNMRWSVKNQARMHLVNEEEPYESLEDAIAKFPETATAIAVRLGTDGNLKTVAPHGFSDLFRLIVAPTPAFGDRRGEFEERIRQKQWIERWPKLRVV